MVEKNLTVIFKLEFVTSEFQLHELRVDTLGFDTESKSFVIIEYKRDKNISVIDQGAFHVFNGLSSVRS
jgi:RecB family endonuclease NucS